MKRAFFFLVIIFAVNLPGLYYQWYLDFWWFDVVLHFLGGFFIAMFFAAYLKDHLLNNSKPGALNKLSARPSTDDISALVKNALILVGAAMFIGVIWEFAEYIANQTLTEPFYRYFGVKAYFMGDLSDTVNDLTMDMLGAGLFALSRTKFFR